MRTRRSQSSSDPVPSSARHSSFERRRPSLHRSVLLHEALEALDVRTNETVVDATLGGAGHAKEIVRQLGPGGLFIGFDLDSDAVSRAKAALKGSVPRVMLINANFRNLANELKSRGITTIDKALFDLGWSSDQLEAGRGFSFLSDEPLMMTYAKDGAALTAATIVNQWSAQSIADILHGWGEERYARRIARAIVAERLHNPFTSSVKLAQTVKAAVPRAYARGRIHPATKTFQALRIAVNDELGALAEGLKSAWEILSPCGRIAVITFHSIEDRLVKRQFLEWERNGEGRRANKKPIAASMNEVKENPRARSAKLRVIEKTEHFYEKKAAKNQQV